MTASPRGLYEALLTESLQSQLAELGDRYQTECVSLDSAKAADRLALHHSLMPTTPRWKARGVHYFRL